MIRYLSVFALNSYIQAKLKQDSTLANVYIKGEISNCNIHSSGHIYFTLKDERARINAIMFKSYTGSLTFKPENGMKVKVNGFVSTYEVTGQCQLYIKKMEQDGLGDLHIAFEKLKNKLSQEGLFDQRYKKPIPTFPRRIAVLSAKEGAGLRDVIKIMQNRFPFARVIVFPIPVQGKGAYQHIINMLEFVDTLKFDTIILARGGGSIEELWNFNEEALARKIFELNTPLISAIGHETDYTICDFVSDWRSPTPTAAAVDATPDQNELYKQLHLIYQSLIQQYQQTLRLKETELRRLTQSYIFKNPDNLYASHVIYLERLKERLLYMMKMFDMKQHELIVSYQKQLTSLLDQYLAYRSSELLQLMAKLDALSPLKVMQRGYSLVKKDNQIIKSVHDLKQGDIIDITLSDGCSKAVIK